MPDRLSRVLGVLAAFAALLEVSLPALDGQTFHSGIDVVLIDVNVVGPSHQPVTGLVPADFVVTVDGRPRSIMLAHFVSRRATGSFLQRSASDVPEQVPVSANSPIPPRNLLFVIDTDSIDAGDGLMIRRALDRLLSGFAANDRIGVVAIPSNHGPTTITRNRDDVRKAISSLTTGNERFRPQPYSIGLAEAFAVERGDSQTMQRILARECKGNDTFCRDDVRVLVRQVYTQAHIRAQRSLDAIYGLAESLSALAGPKTVVLVSGGTPTPDIRAGYDYARLGAALAAAQVSLYTIYLPPKMGVTNPLSLTFAEDLGLEREGVERVTGEAGGTFLESIGDPEREFTRIATELSGEYLLGIEVLPTDRDGRPHRVEVSMKRPGLWVRARSQYVIERPNAKPAVRAGAAAVVARPVRPRDTTTGTAAARDVGREVQQLLSMVADYVARYRLRYSGFVTDEDYRQRTTTAERRLRSDLLLVRTEGPEGWVSFRDVYEVDSIAVRDRDERLKKLFLEPAPGAIEQIARIKEESARYNIGDVVRNVNVPLFALMFLDAANIERFHFTLADRGQRNGVHAIELRYTERQRPTIVDGMPASGSFLVEAVTGAIIQSRAVFIDAQNQSAAIAVEYSHDPAVGLWLPAGMDEEYRGSSGNLVVRGTATYSRFRRFQVTTEETIRK